MRRQSQSAGSPGAIGTARHQLTITINAHPLVVSMRTFQRFGGLIGVNQLFWQTALSSPPSRVVVAPNRDTLYSIAVLDLRSEPMVLTLPEVTDRYLTYHFLDACRRRHVTG